MQIDTGSDKFVKLKLDIWDAILMTLTIGYVIPPFSKNGKERHKRYIRQYMEKENYELIAMIHTIKKNGNYAWLIIARKRYGTPS